MIKACKRVCAVWMTLLLAACTDGGEPVVPNPPEREWIQGADMSWVSEMEAAGKLFYPKEGGAADPFALLRALGGNTVRFRVWVNPAGGWNGKADVLAKAARATASGLKVGIDFHYSDSWADPGKQTPPAAWAGLSSAGLKAALTEHTAEVLQALKAAGVKPVFVQVGNETNNGMLWPAGRASDNMAAFAGLVDAGYAASKSVFPDVPVAVHLSNGWDASLYRWLFDGLQTHGARWDVIGLSLYPTVENWRGLNAAAEDNMRALISRYGKPVLVAEVGMPWDAPDAAHAFLSDLLTRVRALPGGKGLGVLYWEPQAYGQWQGYTLGAFDNSGRPTRALEAFR